VVGKLLIPELSSSGIKVPCREPWETKSFKRRETVHGNEEESRQEEETLSERDARSEFPRVSGEKHLSGRVLVRCAITTTGEAQNCAVIHGEPELAAPIIQWLKKTRFQPATLGGKPVPIWYLFTFNIRSQ